MKKSKIKIEVATIDHAKEFYGKLPKSNFKGYAALLNKKVVGIGGLSFEKDAVLLFSDMKDEMRPFKKDIWKGIGILGDLVKKTNYPIVAIASNKEKNSEWLLTELGFKPNGQSTPDGNVFWRIP